MSALEEGRGSTSRPNRAYMSTMTRGVTGTTSSSSDFGLEDSPRSRNITPIHRPLHPPPRGRNTSLSSSSILSTPMTPEKNRSNPDFGSPQSEQLPFFKDYYSSDDIHPGDKVATLWAYSPRAPDEFELERGDMIKVVGIWDDGKNGNLSWGWKGADCA